MENQNLENLIKEIELQESEIKNKKDVIKQEQERIYDIIKQKTKIVKSKKYLEKLVRLKNIFNLKEGDEVELTSADSQYKFLLKETFDNPKFPFWRNNHYHQLQLIVDEKEVLCALFRDDPEYQPDYLSNPYFNNLEGIESYVPGDWENYFEEVYLSSVLKNKKNSLVNWEESLEEGKNQLKKDKENLSKYFGE